MSGSGPSGPSWVDRIRHWLWLDHPRRSDNSQANRGFYPGGLPVYGSRKPVGWRFLLPVVAIGVVIALLILATRGASAQPAEEGQRLVLEDPGFAVTLPADWEVESDQPWEEPCGDTVWASAGRGGVWDGDQHCVVLTSRCLSANLVSYPPGHREFESVYEWLDLPAGRALYIEDEQFAPHLVASYRIARGVKDYVIACNGAEPPQDRWRSIAQSFEFLQDEHEVAVRRPAVTLTFPAGWSVLEDDRQATGAPGWAGLLWASDGASTCRLQYDTRLPTEGVPLTSGQIHAAYRTWLGSHSAEVADSTEVVLPIGPALRTDWAVDWADGQMPHSTYELDANGAHVRFVCGAVSPPHDRWLSLAEAIAPGT